MNERIGRLVAVAGVERPAAEKAGGIVMQSLTETERARAPMDKLPGAPAAMKNGSDHSSSGGLFDGGVLAAGSRMTGAGFGLDQVAASREQVGFARETAGVDAVDDIVGAIPGLHQFV